MRRHYHGEWVKVVYEILFFKSVLGVESIMTMFTSVSLKVIFIITILHEDSFNIEL